MTNFIPKPSLLALFFWAFCAFILRGGAQAVKPYGILINEFMADPSPPVCISQNPKACVPNAEYIELYNRTGYDISLEGYKIYNDSAMTPLQGTLKKNGFLTIHTKKSGINFGINDALPVAKLVVLNNPNDAFYLQSPDGRVIDAAQYDLSYYQDPKKDDGGYSLNRQNPNAPCVLTAWAASKSPIGGTPSAPNSESTQKDSSPVLVERYYLKADNKTLTIVFNKSLDSASAVTRVHYQISNHLKIDSIRVRRPFFNELEIHFEKAFGTRDTGSILIKSSLPDCQMIKRNRQDTLQLRRADNSAKPQELIINEVLVNPETGGSRFVEIYNASENKVFDIADFKIGDSSKRDIKSIGIHRLILPKDYLVLTENKLYLTKRYGADPFKMVQMKLPTWGEASGNISLLFDNETIDNVNYQKSWHNPLIANTEGVSLERIHPKSPSQEASSWQSASASSAYGTPTGRNSQASLTPSVSTDLKGHFSLDRNSFSPDSDGQGDFLILKYRMETVGTMATIQIFDDKGRRVKTLITNKLLNTEGVEKWQGDTDEGQNARIGIYIIVIDLINASGQKSRQKLPCWVGGRL
jgi:hypothetical protein